MLDVVYMTGTVSLSVERRTDICGLVGIAGEITSKDEKAFRTLLILDTLRGEHSTGVAAVRKNDNEIYMAKQVGPAFELLDSKRYDKALSGFNHVLIGHNRYATVGSVNKANAHPFEFEHVVGAHNGTLTERYNLHESRQFTTDSEALYNHINEFGIEDAIKHCRGAYALTWFDRRDKTMNFLRNKERTLYVTLSESGKSVYWASEKWMLEVALSRQGIKYTDITLIAEDTWMHVKVEEGKLSDAQFQKVLPPPAPVYQAYSGRAHGSYYYPYQGNTITKENSAFNSSSLMGKTDILLEVVDATEDGAHGCFYTLHDPITKNEKIKLYFSPKRGPHFVAGDLITCDINQWKEGHYIVNPTTVEIASLNEDFADDPAWAVLTGEEEEPELEYLTHTGEYVDEHTWNKMYPDCAWCSDPLEAGADGNYLGRNGDCLCPSCAQQTDVKSYLTAAA